MPKKNHYVTSALTSYVNSSSPGFALMIDGPWGVGKTFFIKDFINKNSNASRKYLLISLYGLSSTDQIDYEIFRTAHPVLSSKPMRIIGRSLTTAIKQTTKVDFNNDGKDDGSVSLQIPDVSWMNIIGSQNHILCFDDIERCNIKANELFGYINYYVESLDRNVIIITNEKELQNKIESDQELKRYASIKEKMIGRAVILEEDADSIVTNIINSITHPDKKYLLNLHKDIIVKIFNMSSYSNFRHVKYAIKEFSEIYYSLDRTIKKDEKLTRNLLIIFMALTIEMKAGSFPTEAISNLIDELCSFTTYKNNNEISKIAGKYSGLRLIDPFMSSVLDPLDWLSLLKFGRTEEGINLSISKNRILKDQEPDWFKLYHFMHLDDNECLSLIDKTIKYIDESEIKDIRVIMHIVGIFLKLSSIGILQQDKEILIDKIKNCVHRNIRVLDYFKFRSIDHHEFGIPIYLMDTDEFRDIEFAIIDIIHDYKISIALEKDKEFVDSIEQQPTFFAIEIENRIHYGKGEDNYNPGPIFNAISCEHFINIFNKLDYKNQTIIIDALHEWRIYVRGYKNWDSEEVFFQDLESYFNKKSSSTHVNKLDSYRYSEFYTIINHANTRWVNNPFKKNQKE